MVCAFVYSVMHGIIKLRSQSNFVYILGLARPVIVHLERTPVFSDFGILAVVAVAIYTAINTNLWLASSAVIGIAFGVVLSQHKFLPTVSTRGRDEALVVELQNVSGDKVYVCG